ncbi:carbonic anhydrase [Aliikangiella maris]|uniref:Carbonic anhydrase n=2 Tax=Aliikangiella maris TaxID=3162458 RepID=A0ABV3MJI0_9GAMM
MKLLNKKTLGKVCHIGCLVLTGLFAQTMNAGSGAAWSYSGETGPEHWGDLSPAYAKCKTGREQSPVDLNAAWIDDENELTLKSRFKPVPLTVVNNGHTVQVNIDNESYTKTERGRQRLLQFHFHSLSEHTINGQSFPLEAHFVHIDDDGVLSVLGVLFSLGDENETLKSILAIAPKHKGEATAKGVELNPKRLLGSSETESYYRLQGSLTTPPCSEEVNWYVSTEIQQLSSSQFKQFQKLFHGGNARPVQPLFERQAVLRMDD